jgi:hypothetical protein
MSELCEDYVSFGKYCGMTIDVLLKDRSYCHWIIDQEWFKNYSHLYKKVLEYDPKIYFIPENYQETFHNPKDFINNFKYFNLTQPENLKIKLPDFFLTTYKFYLNLIQNLKNSIIVRLNEENNPYDIKAPSKFIKKFEKETGLGKEVMKTFLYQYELPNILNILELIKKQGGLTYNGNKGWLIAKKRSEDQENWWESKLKKTFGDDKISTQFNFKGNCFDFIFIARKIIFEAKLGIKDFNLDQYKKYLETVKYYNIIYLIAKNTIIDIHNEIIYTQQDPEIFLIKQSNKKFSEISKLDQIIKHFKIESVNNITDALLKI